MPAGSRASHLTRPLQWAGPERSAPEAAGRCCLLPITRRDDRTHCGRSRASPGLPRLLCSLRLPTVREGLAPPLTPTQSRPCSTSCGSPVSLGPASFTRARPPSLLRPQLPLLAPSRPHYVRPQPSLFLRSRLPSLFEPQLPSPVPASLPRSSGAGLPLGSGPPSLLRPRPPLLFPPRPSRSIPALTVAAGGRLRAQGAVARYAGPQIVFAHDPQRPALEGPQQQHLLPLLQHAGGVARHSGREAAGGRRRRGRGLGPAPPAWPGRRRLLGSRYRERPSLD